MIFKFYFWTHLFCLSGELREYSFIKEREKDKEREKYFYQAEVKGAKEGTYECMAVFNSCPIQVYFNFICLNVPNIHSTCFVLIFFFNFNLFID